MRKLSINDNKIIDCSNFLLRFCAELETHEQAKKCQSHMEAIHDQLLIELKNFKFALRKLRFSQLEIEASSYCIASYLDETIMNSELCQSFDWSKRSLLSIVHNETWGGENFYLIFNYAEQHSRKYHQLYEFIYLLISLGYKGKFYSEDAYKKRLMKNLDFIKISEKNSLEKYHIKINQEKPFDAVKVKKFFWIMNLLMVFTVLAIATFYNQKLEAQSQVSLTKIVNTLSEDYAK